MNVSRCGECRMPSTSGPLYVSGRRALCGMCLWSENADLRRQRDEYHMRLLASHAVVRTISTGTIAGGAKVLSALFMLDPGDDLGRRLAVLTLKESKKKIQRRKGSRSRRVATPKP